MATAALLWGLAPAVANAATSVTDFSALSTEVSAGHNVMLGADITATDSTLTVSASRAVAIDLNSHDLSITAGVGDAAIDVPAGAELIIKDLAGGGTATATGGTGQAGIRVAPGAQLTIRGGDTTATGGTGAAGIGGGANQASGLVTVHAGLVTAKGGTGAAGIGGGTGAAGNDVVIDGGQVTATGGTGGAGIGGGNGADGGSLDISHSSVFAEGGNGAAGVGSGAGAGGGVAVQIGDEGFLQAENGSASAPAISLGSLSNAGILRLPDSATLPVPTGVTVQNAGLIRARGDLTGTGTVHNTGTILPTGPGGTVAETVADKGQGPAGTALLVNDHNYTVKFVLDGAPGTAPDPLDVYAATIKTSRQTLPTLASQGDFTFTGWYTQAVGGTKVTDTTVLDTVTDSGPSVLTLHPHYNPAASVTVTFDARGGAPTPDTQTLDSGQTATEPATDPAKDGVTFRGWFTAASGGDRWDFDTDTVDADLTLYAHYRKNATTPTSTAPSSSGVAPTSTGPVTTSPVSGPLADTGTDSHSDFGLAVLLLGAGLGLLYAGRNRAARYLRRH